jgi:hypothetical protein
VACFFYLICARIPRPLASPTGELAHEKSSHFLSCVLLQLGLCRSVSVALVFSLFVGSEASALGSLLALDFCPVPVVR